MKVQLIYQLIVILPLTAAPLKDEEIKENCGFSVKSKDPINLTITTFDLKYRFKAYKSFLHLEPSKEFQELINTIYNNTLTIKNQTETLRVIKNIRPTSISILLETNGGEQIQIKSKCFDSNFWPPPYQLNCQQCEWVEEGTTTTTSTSNGVTGLTPWFLPWLVAIYISIYIN